MSYVGSCDKDVKFTIHQQNQIVSNALTAKLISAVSVEKYVMSATAYIKTHYEVNEFTFGKM